MMKLTAQERDPKASLEALRAEGLIPAVCYGNGESVVISLNAREFSAVYKETGTSAIIELEGVGDSKDVLIKDIQHHAVSEDVLHIDFYAITQGETIEATIPLTFEGESPAEKAGARVMKVMREVTVSSMPRDLPSEIIVDMTKLAEVGDSLSVKDLVLAEGVTILEDGNEAVVTSSVAQEIVEEEVATTIDMDAIESEQKGKGEDEDESTEE